MAEQINREISHQGLKALQIPNMNRYRYLRSPTQTTVKNYPTANIRVLSPSQSMTLFMTFTEFTTEYIRNSVTNASETVVNMPAGPRSNKTVILDFY